MNQVNPLKNKREIKTLATSQDEEEPGVQLACENKIQKNVKKSIVMTESVIPSNPS